ncbi:helix-turn-helix domain-containing protein [Maridesulfovibrio sp.]|uniref:helix-turn-helix domain-containing protein n=1 Tax=Maridesulfovibrio sp. TaxID=2795000 RepID=UPI003B000C8A
MSNKHLGSSFDDFLMEEDLYEEVTRNALKKVIAWQIAEAMKEQNLSKTAMAKRMNTSRSALDRLLDTENASVTIQTLEKAARAVNKRLVMCLVDSDEQAEHICGNFAPA